MKRMLMILTLVLLCLGLFCACDEGTTTDTDQPGAETENNVSNQDVKDHVHEFGAWQKAIQPTCTIKGEERRVCSVCRKCESREIEAKGHIYGTNNICTQCSSALSYTQGLVYNKIENGTAYEVAGIGIARGGNILIPAYYDELPVISVGNQSFANCVILESVRFAENSKLIYIQSDAFYNCTSLSAIEIPDSVISIGSGAFQNCKSLNNIEIPASVTSIEWRLFSGCMSLKTVTLSQESKVGSIGDFAFRGCANLKSIVIPTKVASIGERAFIGCSGLTEVLIPASVTSIGTYCFNGCTGLKTVNFAEESLLISIGYGAFDGCENLESIKIPWNVLSIGRYAFYRCKNLKKVTFEYKLGWWCFTSTNEEYISSSRLENTATAAQYLTSIYYDYKWENY